jgi:hypothetical protein
MRLILVVVMTVMMSLQFAAAQRLVSPPQGTSPSVAPPAQLQPPFPSSREEIQSPQDKPAASQRRTASEQRGTEDRPAVVKIFPTEKTDAERAQEENDRADKASADWWLRVLTGALVVVGVMQFLALIGQAIVFVMQARSLRESIDLTRTIADRQERDMRDSIDEANRAASAMRDAADAALSQVRLTIARESPVPYLTDWKLEPTKKDIPINGIVANTDYSPAFVTKNIGRSTLQIQAFCIETMLGEFVTVFSGTPKYDEIVTLGNIIQPDKEITLRTTRVVRFTDDEVNSLRSSNRLFWVYGFIRYFNQFVGEDWDAGFSAIINPDGSFVNINLPNYGYHRRYEEDRGNPAPPS